MSTISVHPNDFCILSNSSVYILRCLNILCISQWCLHLFTVLCILQLLMYIAKAVCVFSKLSGCVRIVCMLSVCCRWCLHMPVYAQWCMYMCNAFKLFLYVLNAVCIFTMVFWILSMLSEYFNDPCIFPRFLYMFWMFALWRYGCNAGWRCECFLHIFNDVCIPV